MRPLIIVIVIIINNSDNNDDDDDDGETSLYCTYLSVDQRPLYNKSYYSGVLIGSFYDLLKDTRSCHILALFVICH